MAKVVVLGGGITGRLIHYVIPQAQIFDGGAAPVAMGRPKLTRQYGANYLWQPIPGLPCYSFPVETTIDGDRPTIESVARYKQKIGKGYEIDQFGLRDLLRRQFPSSMVGYDLERLPDTPISYDHRAVEVNVVDRRVVWANGVVTSYDYLLSTIPLYTLVGLITPTIDVAPNMFRFDPIYVKVTPRPPDAPTNPDTLHINYLSAPDVPAYRWCDRFGERHYEGLSNMGTLPNKKLIPGKIHDLPSARRDTLTDFLALVNVYGFGRYGRWRSDELVHETFDHILQFARRLAQ